MVDIKAYIERTSQLLPNIRPLKAFLHLNMFPDLLDHNFWDALELTQRSYNWNPFHSISQYKELYFQGHIKREQLEKLLKGSSTDSSLCSEFELLQNERLLPISEKSYRPIHKCINTQIQVSLNELTEPLLIRFISCYFDQGISKSRMPLAEDGIYKCFKNLCTNSYLPFYPIKKTFFDEAWSDDPEEVIKLILSKLLAGPDLYENYIQECYLSLRGWSGLIKTIQREPDLLIHKRPSSLLEFLAIRLIIEHSWIEHLFPDFSPITRDVYEKEIANSPVSISKRDLKVFKVWQKAYERTYLSKIVPFYRRHLSFEEDITGSKFQAVFCIDDRECFLRHAVENTEPNCSTFGTAGHFGLDFNLKYGEGGHPIKHCPAPVEAKFTLTKKNPRRKKQKYKWSRKFNLLREYIDVFYEGGFGLWESIQHTLLHKETKMNPIEFHLPFEINPFQENGYTVKEAAMRISDVLKSIALTRNFSRHVFIVGHTSTSVNNPYFTAYGCGACSGQNGAINAVVFCSLINNSQVRQILVKEYNISIPETTTFIAACHDTCREVITLYVNDNQKHVTDVKDFCKILTRALESVALKRISDFEYAPKNSSGQEALWHLESRSRAIFEPRPELGHTNNALCIIGRRVQGFTFERRAFLQSYDPVEDNEGKTLEGILMATIPVCGGISLDYFFSKINPMVGAGSKLSHNITSLIGVSHGTEDDLLCGLATQMVEMHQAMRITFIIEQEPLVLAMIMERNKTIRDWIQNEWIQLVLHNSLHQMLYYENGEFIDFHEAIPC